MNHKYIFLCLIVAFPLFTLGQSDSTRFGSISGIVKDSSDHNALPAVTITIYQKSDSSLLNYQVSSDNGVFKFTGLPLDKSFRVVFSFTGYKTVSKIITLGQNTKNYDFKEVLLARNHELLENVVVEAAIPVTMNGDTLEINPAAFKVDSNAVAEDILRKVPGITMWGDGTITVNGKKVNNVYVDGKQFFGSDPAIATQNLPKHAIEKIQVYQEEDYTKDNIDKDPSDSLLTMNIQLKANKRKGYFGKAGAGYGTDNRYESDLSVLAFNKKLRGGLAASTNNINKSAGLQEMFKQSTFRNYNPSNRYVANFGSAGINKVSFLGANFQYDLSDQNTSRFVNQVRANYTLSRGNNFLSSQSNSRNSATDVVFLDNTQKINSSENTSQSAGLNYNKRAWDKDFSINAGFNTSTNNAISSGTSIKAIEGGNEISESASNTNSSGKSKGITFTTAYKNKDDDDRNLKSFGINYNLSYNEAVNERTTISNLISFANPDQNTYFNRLNNSNSSNFNSKLGMNYNALKRLLFGNFNLWDINLVLNNTINFSNISTNTGVSDYDSLKSIYINNDSLSNNNRINHFEESPSLRISKNFSKTLSGRFRRYLNIVANATGLFISDKNESNFSYRNINRDYSFFNPSVSFDYNYQKFTRYTFRAGLSGSRSYSIPSIDQLSPIIDTSTNIYSINLGNRDLLPSQTDAINFTLNYIKEKTAGKTDYNIGISGGARNINNAIADSSYYDNTTGRRTMYLINLNGRKVYTGNLDAAISFKFKNDRILQFSYSGSLSNTVSPNYIDGARTITQANNLGNGLNIFFSLDNIGNITLSQSINTSFSRQSAKEFKSLKTINYTTQGNVNVNLTRDLTISNTFNYIKNNSLPHASALWNAFATYRFLKTKQAEIKLTAMDILRQNKNITSTASLNNLTTTVTNGLQQFYMITLSYFPRQFGGGRGPRFRGSDRQNERNLPEFQQRDQNRRQFNGNPSRSGGFNRNRY